MTTFSEYLIESFDKPYPFRLRQVDGKFYEVKLMLPDNTLLYIEFELDPQEDTWLVGFSRNQSTNKTGQGDQMRIFATVIEAMKEFIENEQPRNISFAAQKQVPEYGDSVTSRERLYTRMIRRFAGSLGYTVNSEPERYGTTYYLRRKW